MKLRNKKTGEIINSKDLLTDEFIIDLFSQDFDYFISKLNKINEEWEDYEELKYYWYIRDSGDVKVDRNDGFTLDIEHKRFGNYFKTKEEAEKAVEKLKAWKRLKDKGFKFDRWSTRTLGSLQINVKFDEYKGISPEDKEYLDLLFGGEE